MLDSNDDHTTELISITKPTDVKSKTFCLWVAISYFWQEIKRRRKESEQKEQLSFFFFHPKTNPLVIERT